MKNTSNCVPPPCPRICDCPPQKSSQLCFECDCPYAEEHFCKHMVAAALEVSEYLKEDFDDFEEEAEEFP